MSKPPAFQFYANDFIGATITWDAIACGMYIRLLCTQWVNGSIPDDQRRIAKAAGVELAELMKEWHLLEPKFPLCKDGTRKNPKLEAVRSRQEEISASRARSASTRWGDANANANANAYAKQMQRKEKEKEKDTMVLHDTSKDINDVHGIHVSHDARAEIWPTFDDWWAAYGKKIDRPKCEAKWARMSRSDRELAYRHTEAYVIATPDVTFRRHPATYLNNRNWNDDDLTRPRGQSSGKRPEQLTREERRAMVLAEVAKYNAGVDGGTGGKS